MSEHSITITEHAKLECALRELNYRRRVYPRLVERGTMSKMQADREIALMSEIASDYSKIVRGERLI